MKEAPLTHLNLIAGEWLAGESEIENRNPSDLSDVIGQFSQANSSQLNTTLAQAQTAQREWAQYGLECRQAILMNIGN